MSTTDLPLWADAASWVFGAAAVVSGYRVFRTDSMVRASFLLLASFLNVGAIVVLLGGRYLGFALFMMMTVEMMVMAIFMVAFMMNPAGLNPMNMVHQPKIAAAAGWIVFAGGLVVALTVDFPDRPLPAGADVIAALGEELLGRSMLVFESAGVTLLAAMVGAVVLSSRRGRFGVADEDSLPPPLDPDTGERPEDRLAGDTEPGHGHHGGHG